MYPHVLPSSLSKSHNKDKEIKTQTEKVFEYLQAHTATASMVTEATGVPQKNICRIKRKLEKAGQLEQLFRKRCKWTGYKAWYLNCNPAKFRKDRQLSLFE